MTLQNNLSQLGQSHPVAQVHSEAGHRKINLRQNGLLVFNTESQLAQVLVDIALARQIVLGEVDQKRFRRLDVVRTVAHGEQARIASQNAHALALVEKHNQAQHLLQHCLILRLAQLRCRVHDFAVRMLNVVGNCGRNAGVQNHFRLDASCQCNAVIAVHVARNRLLQHCLQSGAQPKRVVVVQHGDELVSQTNVVANVSISSDAQPAFFDLLVQVEQNGLEERALKNAAQLAPCGKVLSECTVNGQS